MPETTETIVVGAVIIRERSGRKREILLVRERGDDFWTFPGGTLEESETREECLIREIKEELPGFRFRRDSLRPFRTYFGQAPHDAGEIQLVLCWVAAWGGFRLGNGIEEARFTDDPESLNLAPLTRKAIAAFRRERRL